MNLEGAWGKSEGLSTIRTLKHKSLIIAHESALSKGKEMVGRAMFSTAVRGWKDGRKGGGSAGGDLKGTWMHFPAVNQTGLETKET